jgi:uncharacterized repeat protein (TIGR01451 family)
MRTEMSQLTKGLRVVVLVLVVLAPVLVISGARPSLGSADALLSDPTPWYDPGWSYRRAVTISSPCGQVVTDYQTQVLLDNSFDFSKAKSDGSDVRLTASDGTTLISYWIESWSPGTTSASIWVKVPQIPTAGTTIYLYYGNASPTPPAAVETPPIGPWARATGNPIHPIGDSGNGANLLAENIVYDSITGHYWMVFANYRDGSVGLVWSDTPTDPASWHWQGSVINSANAPHILSYNGLWYIFYADYGHGGTPTPISVSTATSIAGPYTYVGPVLTSTYAWEAYRVDEPFVFQRNDGKWILMYMGDSGGAHEQVSYASADNILGPYTKYGSTPALPFGPAGSYDAGTVADPWVVEFHGTYYIGYTVSSTTSSPWQTAYATTADWQTFTKQGLTLPLASSGWDSNNSFRGAVTRIGNTYVFPYTGDGYMMGIATQPVYSTITLNDPSTIFSFFDDFPGTSLDTTTKWVSPFDSGSSSQAVVSGGTLTLTATGTYVKIHGQTAVGMDYMFEVRASHPQAGQDQKIPEIGLAGGNFSDIVRIVSDFHCAGNPGCGVGVARWERQVKAFADGSVDPWINMAQAVDTGWHTFRVYRSTASPNNIAGFQIDNNAVETYVSGSGTTHVPTINLPAFLMSYGSGNQFIVDWVRIRKWCGANAGASVGTEQPRPLSGHMTISKTGDAQIASGSVAHFSISVTNTGDYVLSNVAVTDTLAPDCNRTFGSLALGEIQTWACTLAGATADFTNIANASATTPSEEPVTAVASFFVDVIHPAISLSLAPATQEVIQGTSATFTVLVTNGGDVALSNVAVTDAVVPDCARTIGTLAAGASNSYTCSRTNAASSFVNSADASGQPPVGASPTASATASVTVRSLTDATWLDPAWRYRRPMLVSSPCGQAVTDYQVRLALDSSFDFANALPDGSDLRVTALDGTTAIPFWIETWSPGTTSASVWVKVPQIPTAGTAVFLYYGNPSAPGAPLVETPPIGPWTKAAGNPIAPIGHPTGSLLAEKFVYDSVTGHYWMVHANYNDGGVGLVWSDTPADATSWHWYGTVISAANAPHILQYNSTWYIFYSDWSGNYNSPHSLFVSTASSVTGPYTYAATVLSPSLPWETWRVDEPYVFQRNDGKWILVYMADQARAVEQVGYAIADDILGPYTKFAGNPCLAFGPPGSFDAGTIADPWVVEFHGTYYIGYTVSPTTSSPWQTAYATTTDWQTFTKHGVILPLAASGWDSVNSFRGAVTRVGDTWVFSYTGDSYQMGIATQPVYVAQPWSDPTKVFSFFDAFDGTQLDSSKWSTQRQSAMNGTVSVNGGILTLTASGSVGTYDIIQLVGTQTMGTGVLLETYARHPDADGTLDTAAEVGFSDATRTNMIRIMDYTSVSFLKAATANGSSDALIPMARALDTQNFLLHRVYRNANGQAWFSLENDAWETITTNVPTGQLPAWFMAYSAGKVTHLEVDWVRVRNWCGADAPVQGGTEQPFNCALANCDDANLCTTDGCDPETGCTHLAVSCDDGDVCTDDSCVPATGCAHVNNTASCNDGDACSYSDVCAGGTCHGTPITCADDACNTRACNGTSTCTTTPRANGTSCDDSNLCTYGDVCTAGVCGGTPITCTDAPCETRTCNGTSTCTVAPKADGSACDDGNPCTYGDECAGGTCGGLAVTCTDGACITRTCNGSSSCTVAPKANGTACDDGSLCTQSDTCQGGTCVGSDPVICSDGNPCTDDTCNPATGGCVYVPNDANSCTDGNVCTSDACSGGACVHSASGLCGVTGTVSYYRDTPAGGSEPSTKPVPGVGIDGDQDATAEGTTDPSGAYALGNLFGDVVLTALPKYGTPRAADHNGAISSLDASVLARGVVGLLTLSANQRVAGEVTGDGTVSSTDASYIARFAVGLVDHFPVAATTGSDWKFLKCEPYGPPSNPGCGSPVYSFSPISQAETGKNFYALLYGDVTGNWQPSTGGFAAAGGSASTEEQVAIGRDLETAREIARKGPSPFVERPAGEAALSLSGWKALRAGERRQLTVDLRNADGILGLDLSLTYDPTRIAIVGLETTGIASQMSVVGAGGAGTYRIAGYGVTPLAGSGPVLTITVEALERTGRGLPLQIGGIANEGQIPLRIGGRGEVSSAKR